MQISWPIEKIRSQLNFMIFFPRLFDETRHSLLWSVDEIHVSFIQPFDEMCDFVFATNWQNCFFFFPENRLSKPPTFNRDRLMKFFIYFLHNLLIRFTIFFAVWRNSQFLFPLEIRYFFFATDGRNSWFFSIIDWRFPHFFCYEMTKFAIFFCDRLMKFVILFPNRFEYFFRTDLRNSRFFSVIDWRNGFA